MSQPLPSKIQPKRLTSETKKAIAFSAVEGQTITDIAKQNHVSRNTVYAQKSKAYQAINNAFEDAKQTEVLFTVPITKSLIEQMVICLTLINKSSYRDSLQFFTDIFDYSMSIGNIFNILDRTEETGTQINNSYDLSLLKVSAADEIFHQNQPVLAVVDISSRFCAKLTKEDSRDSDSWGVALLDMIEQDYQPKVNINDQAPGLIKAFEDQLPETVLHYDHFHLLKASKELVRHLKNSKESSITAAIKLIYKEEKQRIKGKLTISLSEAITAASADMHQAESLYEQVNTLCSWLQYDVLQHAGFSPDVRADLYDFIIAELSLLKSDNKKLDSYIRSLVFQKTRLLAASQALNYRFETIALENHVSLEDVWQICYTTRFDINAHRYHLDSQMLADVLGDECYDKVEDEVLLAMAETPRCSSMIENFNSRLRPFLDDRKQVTQKKLSLCQFILNHRPFQRSHHLHLVGKTPAEAFTNKPHPHWLEMLGYQQFQQAA
jgi:hypothetical protein